MKGNYLKGLGEKVVAYRPVFTEIAGRLSAGVLLSQINYWWWTMKGKPFYKTDKDFCQELGMGLDEFKAAKKLLIEKGLIQVKKWGIPQRSNYFLEVDMVESALTSRREFHQLDGGDSTNCAAEIPPTNTETTHRVSTESMSPAEKPPTELPEFLGKQPIHRIATVYNLKYQELYGREWKATNWAQLTKLYKPLLAENSEWLVAAMVLLHFDWAGASGEDEFTHRRLSEKCFPLEWVPKAYNEYTAYLQNALNVNLNDDDEVKKWVVSIIKPLYAKYGKHPRKDTATESTA